MSDGLNDIDIRWGDTLEIRQDTRNLGTFLRNSGDLINVENKGQPRAWIMTTSILAHIPLGVSLDVFSIELYLGAGQTMLTMPLQPPTPVFNDTLNLFTVQFPASTIRMRYNVQVTVGVATLEDFLISVTSIVGPLVAYSDYERRAMR